MSYKNPIPSVDDVDVAKRFFVSPIFSFNEHMTIEEAAHGISELIRQNNGKIPAEWVKFADAPGIRRTSGKKITFHQNISPKHCAKMYKQLTEKG